MAKTSRSKAYLKFIRSHASCLAWDATDAPWPPEDDAMFDPDSYATVAHHVRMGGNGGVGLKPSDYRTVPLSDSEHRELHQAGERSWWANLGVDPRQVMIALLRRWNRIEDVHFGNALPRARGEPSDADFELAVLIDLAERRDRED